MIRILFLYSLLFMLPFGLYALWRLFEKKRNEETDDETAKALPILIVTGLCLLGGVLWLFQTDSRAPDGTTYIPPHMENGNIVSGRHLAP